MLHTKCICSHVPRLACAPLPLIFSEFDTKTKYPQHGGSAFTTKVHKQFSYHRAMAHPHVSGSFAPGVLFSFCFLDIKSLWRISKTQQLSTSKKKKGTEIRKDSTQAELQAQKNRTELPSSVYPFFFPRFQYCFA